MIHLLIGLIILGAIIEFIGPPRAAPRDDPRDRLPKDTPPPGWLE